MDMKSALAEWGLNEKEATIYLYLLENNFTFAQNISKETGILRQTVYEILRKLENNGLVSEIKENKKTYYSALKPENLISKLKEKEKIVASILPELHDLMKTEKTNVDAQLYRGIKGIKSINEEVLKSKEILTILPSIGEQAMREFYIENFSKRRIEKKISIRILRGKIQTKIQEKIRTDNKSFREVRVLKDLENIQTQYILFDHSVAIISYHQEPFGIIIKDNLINHSIKTIFSILWRIGKPY